MTFAANCSKNIKYYNKVGEAAEINGVNKKHKFYNEYFDVKNSNDTALVIFAVENDGAIAMESLKFLNWLVSSDPKYGLWVRTCLSVCIQKIRAQQIIFTRKRIGVYPL